MTKLERLCLQHFIGTKNIQDDVDYSSILEDEPCHFWMMGVKKGLELAESVSVDLETTLCIKNIIDDDDA